MLLEYGNVTTPDTWRLDERRGTGYCRIYFIHSTDAIYEDQFDRVALEPAHLYVLPSALPYQASRRLDGTFHCTYLHVSIFPLHTKRLISRPIAPDSLEHHLWAAIERAIDAEDRRMIEALAAAAQALFAEDPACRCPTGAFRGLLAYIMENLDRELSVKQLSDMMHFHPHYFIKVFRRETGCSPHQYILNLRMHEAARLIQGGAAIGAAAEAVGYGDSSSFARAYKAFWGASPSSHVYQHTIP